MIKHEKPKINAEPSQPTESTSKSKPTNKENLEGEVVKKLNNVELSIKEKQIKTTNENVKGNVQNTKTAKSKVVEDKPETPTSKSNENLNQPDVQESSSEQVVFLSQVSVPCFSFNCFIFVTA